MAIYFRLINVSQKISPRGQAEAESMSGEQSLNLNIIADYNLSLVESRAEGSSIQVGIGLHQQGEGGTGFLPLISNAF